MNSEQFIEYLNARAPGFKCDVCGHDDWLVNADVDMQTALVHTTQNITHPTLVAMCGHCGQVKFFFLSMVLAWLDNRENHDG